MNIATEGRAPSDAAHAMLELVVPGLQRLDRTLREIAEIDDPVLAPMLSTVLPGSGKRMRPAIAMLIGRLGSTDPDALNNMAVGVELLHTASLVHDDVVDESDTRRGSATLFTRVGNALAVLVGDYLFSKAAQACVATGDLRVVQLFAKTLGDMAQGQVLDANAQATGQTWRTMTRERYFRTITGKTASLFVLACEGTAILAGFNERQIEAMRTYGERLGLAFQVVDDVLDFTSTEEALGKPVGGDLRQGTITLPVILMRERELANGRMTAVFGADDIEAQINLVRECGAADAALAEAAELVRQAQDALETLPEGVERDRLYDLAAYVLERRA
jgi:geranylgeranyl pyrophosphate synthase